jgi:hypothetical protein
MMLIIAGVGVGVAVDGLELHLGVLELHLLLLVTLGRHAVAAWLLLLLLTELLQKLFDIPAILCAIAPRVVHQKPQTTLITAGGLPQLHVASWAMTPTNRCSSRSGNGSSVLWLVVVVVTAGLLLLLAIFVSDAALSCAIFIGLAGLPYLWDRLGMPCTSFCGSGALVRQAKELRDVLHIMCG